MSNSTELGAGIKSYRNEKGLTLKYLAALCGLSVSYLSDIETGRTTPSIQTLSKITEALGLVLKIEALHPTSIQIGATDMEISLLQALRAKDFRSTLLILSTFMREDGTP